MAAAEHGKHSAGETKGTHIIVDLGSHSHRRISRLRHGEGQLMEDVNEAIRELQSMGKIGPTATPVVIVVKERVSSFLPF